MVKQWQVLTAGLTSALLVAGASAAVASTTVSQNNNAPLWMMGEVHDNAEGHFYRLKDLEAKLGGQWRPALLMEQFNVEQQPALTKAWQTCQSAQCVIDTAGGVKGWDWGMYKPLITLALKYELPLVAANLSSQQVKAVMQSGFSAVFDAQTIKAYKLDQPLPQPWLDNQRKMIAQSHCKALPAAATDSMVKAQASRDVMFAKLMGQYASGGAVLIAGNGHVRRDLGVYQWLPADLASRVKIAGYVEPAGADTLIYDIMRVINEHKRADPCAQFKK
uniref:ChaN family lipoprotein n=1 Tax=Orrella sp. TaxID=1921583 RepID=UPI004047FB36